MSASPTRTARVVTRRQVSTLVSNRSATSTASGISAGSAHNVSHWARWVSNCRTALVVRFVVVSWPAMLSP